MISDDALREAKRDPVVFASELLRAPLWEHQRDVLISRARTRVLACGRQSGKSRTVAVAALHQAFSVENSRILFISAGEEAAQTLLGEVRMLLDRAGLATSTTVDIKSEIALTNGSTIRALPASDKQIRGKAAIDLLILDEASMISQQLYVSVIFTIIARQEGTAGRVIIAGTPMYKDHFFYRAWLSGRTASDALESWRWPSTASPIVDRAALDDLRGSMTSEEYRREVEAEWTDNIGRYFTDAELDKATVDYAMATTENAHGQVAAGGVDWGFSVDANALTLLSTLDDEGLNTGPDPIYFLSLAEAHYKMDYHEFISRIIEVCQGYSVHALAVEVNGVGEPNGQQLKRRLYDDNLYLPYAVPTIVPITTTARLKERVFGTLKILLQSGRLILPQSADTLRLQLESLIFEDLATGGKRISVPSNIGHDDAAMSLAMAATNLNPNVRTERYSPLPHTMDRSTPLVTGRGTKIHPVPHALDDPYPLSAFGQLVT